jgi:hypothetical protein
VQLLLHGLLAISQASLTSLAAACKATGTHAREPSDGSVVIVTHTVPSPTRELLEELLANVTTNFGLQKRYNLKVSVIRSDNELAKGVATRKWLEKSGITFEPSPLHTQDLNGVSERTEGVIFMKGLCMRVQARLPHKLWRETINAAVYLHNRTPRAKNRWATPYTLFHGYLGERRN